MIAASWSIRSWSKARLPAAPRRVSAASCSRTSSTTRRELLAGSLADYMVPTAGDVPDMVMIHQHSPSPLNPLGVKGVGEGGAVAPPAAVANAVADALSPFGAEFNTTSIKPQQIVEAAGSAPPR
jgi:carbon-monoxide dehydrogenase large subunit